MASRWLLALATLAASVACGAKDGGPVSVPGRQVVRPEQAASAQREPKILAQDLFVPESGTWGWISVVETNDFPDNIYVMMDGWYGGVRAYFATRPSWRRAYAGDLSFAKAVETRGACTLYDPQIMKAAGCEDCFCLDKGIECAGDFPKDERWCGQDEICVWGPERPEAWPDRGVCKPLPEHYDVGSISIDGTYVGVSMEPDEYDRYVHKIPPNSARGTDLFDQGDPIAVTAEGGALGPFSLSAVGVAHLEVPDRIVRVNLGEPAEVSWLPADAGARIRLVLRVGSHDPYPVAGAIVCEAEDRAGTIEVDALLLEQLYALSCKGTYTLKPSVIFRYSSDVKAFSDGAIELFVASARGLQVVFD